MKSKFWFSDKGWFYTPKTWQGYLCLLVLVIFNFPVFLAVDSASHSISDTLYGVFPYLIGSLSVYYFIASRKSK